MAGFERMIRYECAENETQYFSHVKAGKPPGVGESVEGFPSFEEFLQRKNGRKVTIKKVRELHYSRSIIRLS